MPAGELVVTRRLPRRVLALLLLVGSALLAGAVPASAHTELIGSDPVDGSRTAAGPSRIALTFSEAVQTGFTTVTVIGPDGAPWQAGPPIQDGAVVTVPVRPLGPVGEYTVGYRVLSVDSHPVQGAVRFTLTAPGPGTAAAPAPSGDGVPKAVAAPDGAASTADRSDRGGTPVWPWIAGAVLLLGAGVAAALRLGRSN
ncbi:MAG: copper resistance protein CopC [Actinomycetota bacterium]|nr:copper resistance protein CopC [Actinomycetota bacterium]